MSRARRGINEERWEVRGRRRTRRDVLRVRGREDFGINGGFNGSIKSMTWAFEQGWLSDKWDFESTICSSRLAWGGSHVGWPRVRSMGGAWLGERIVRCAKGLWSKNGLRWNMIQGNLQTIRFRRLCSRIGILT
ncbi:hypothetical protein AMTR_s00021p00085240, partial [Amborella trichopoda]